MINNKGTKVQIVHGPYKWTDATIRDEVPDKMGIITVSIEDVIVKVPVGDLNDTTGGISIPLAMVKEAMTRLDNSIKKSNTEKEVHNYMHEHFMSQVPTSLKRVWSLAYFVTNPYALAIAQRILTQNNYNVQEFCFKILEESLEEYWNLQVEYPVV